MIILKNLQSLCLAKVLLLLIALFCCTLQLAGQTVPNPIPLVNLPLVPSDAAPGGTSFTLRVNGTGFVAGATVNWNGSGLPTSFISSSQLTAVVPASDLAQAGTASISVSNPAPEAERRTSLTFMLPARRRASRSPLTLSRQVLARTASTTRSLPILMETESPTLHSSARPWQVLLTRTPAA
jgi:hypothetical protein